MQTRQRFWSVFVGGIGLAVCSIAGADAPGGVASPPATTPPVVEAATPTPAANKIWECTTKGVRTFSSNPCGTNPTVRELNPINVMEPARAPMYRVTHTYGPAASAQSPDSAYPNQATTDAVSTDNAYNGYTGYIVVTRSHRARASAARNHPHPHH